MPHQHFISWTVRNLGDSIRRFIVFLLSWTTFKINRSHYHVNVGRDVKCCPVSMINTTLACKILFHISSESKLLKSARGNFKFYNWSLFKKRYRRCITENIADTAYNTIQLVNQSIDQSENRFISHSINLISHASNKQYLWLSELLVWHTIIKPYFVYISLSYTSFFLLCLCSCFADFIIIVSYDLICQKCLILTKSQISGVFFSSVYSVSYLIFICIWYKVLDLYPAINIIYSNLHNV